MMIKQACTVLTLLAMALGDISAKNVESQHHLDSNCYKKVTTFSLFFYPIKEKDIPTTCLNSVDKKSSLIVEQDSYGDLTTLDFDFDFDFDFYFEVDVQTFQMSSSEQIADSNQCPSEEALWGAIKWSASNCNAEDKELNQ